jgi:IclR family transcriptional regulator, KDG regulon repressor
MAGAATVEKALDLLFHLHGARTALGLSEIGRDLDLPKSSCHRLLASLVDREIVERDENGRYRPGLALLSLGLGAQAREPVVRAARPVLEVEAMALGETVFLVARRREKLRVLDKCEGSGFLRAAPEVGDAVPGDVTAAGRLYRVFAEGRTHRLDTQSEAGSLEPANSEDARVLALGYATNRDAWIDGLSVLAVPIWQERSGGGRDLVASLALGAASARFDELGEETIAEHLLIAARGIRERLGLLPHNAKRARTHASEVARPSKENDS